LTEKKPNHYNKLNWQELAVGAGNGGAIISQLVQSFASTQAAGEVLYRLIPPPHLISALNSGNVWLSTLNSSGLATTSISNASGSCCKLFSLLIGQYLTF